MASLTTERCAHEWVNVTHIQHETPREMCVRCNLERAAPTYRHTFTPGDGSIFGGVKTVEIKPSLLVIRSVADPGDEDR